MKLGDTNSRRDYITVNLILTFLFIVFFLFVIILDNPISCYYKKNFTYLCKTCGLTRDFKSILSLNFSNLINPISLNFFLALSMLFISRFLSIIITLNKKKVYNVIIIDFVVIIICMYLMF